MHFLMSHVGIGSEEYYLLGDSSFNYMISFSVARSKSTNNSGENIFSSAQVLDVEWFITCFLISEILSQRNQQICWQVRPKRYVILI